jgi:hypothetical protein
MTNPYSSPAFDLSDRQTLQHACTKRVRWARPTFSTFGCISLLWGFCAGILWGIIGFAQSVFGVETTATILVWHFQGVTAGVVGMLLCPVLFALFAALQTLLFPFFRFGVMALSGPSLYFQTESDQTLYLSRLHLRSYMKLSALYGFLLGLAGSLLLAVGFTAGAGTPVAVAGVPVVFQGTARLIWLIAITPPLYSVYAAVLAVPGFIPFRVITGVLDGATIPSGEIDKYDQGVMCGPSTKRD